MSDMRCDVVLCGVGGQGTVLASRLLSSCAQTRGAAVKAAETIGMSQRGGSVVSHVRMGEGPSSPLVGAGDADLLIGFEPAEALRQLAYVKRGGTVVVANRPIVPSSVYSGGPGYNVEEVLTYLTHTVEHLEVVDAEAAERDLGSSKCLNVVLLGVAVRTGAIPVTADDVRSAIRTLVPERFLDLNLRALDWCEH